MCVLPIVSSETIGIGLQVVVVVQVEGVSFANGCSEFTKNLGVSLQIIVNLIFFPSYQQKRRARPKAVTRI